jgi:FAD/FMN-containing dehydrogenase
LEKATVIGLVADGVLSQDQSQVLDMWGIREYCGPASAKAGYIYKYDLSIPISDFEQFIREMRERLDKHSEALVVNWAHIRDSDLHLNVVTPGIRQHSQEIQDLLEPFIFESVVRRGGSISAEHGLGRCKNEYLTICKGETELSIMSSVKNLFDPNGIMNPGKVL